MELFENDFKYHLGEEVRRAVKILKKRIMMSDEKMDDGRAKMIKKHAIKTPSVPVLFLYSRIITRLTKTVFFSPGSQTASAA